MATYREMMRFFDSVPPDWRIADQWNADVVLWPQHAAIIGRNDVPVDFVATHQDGEYIVFVRRDLEVDAASGTVERPRKITGPAYLSDFFKPEEDRPRFEHYCSEPVLVR